MAQLMNRNFKTFPKNGGLIPDLLKMKKGKINIEMIK